MVIEEYHRGRLCCEGWEGEHGEMWVLSGLSQEVGCLDPNSGEA